MARTTTALPEDEVAAMLEAYQGGMSTAAVALKFGRARVTVCAYVNKAGIMRHKGSLAEDHPEMVERFAALRKEGYGLAAAAQIVNSENGTTHAYGTFRDSMRTLGMRPDAPAATPVKAEPKTEVVFGDLVIRKCTRIVHSVSSYSYGGVTDVPVSLSAGVRLQEASAA